MRVHNVSKDEGKFTFTFMDEEDTKELKITVNEFQFDPDEDDWRFETFPFVEKDKFLGEAVRSVSFMVYDETKYKMAFLVIKALFELQTIPATIKSYNSPGVKTMIIDYNRQFLGDDDVLGYVTEVQHALEDITSRTVEVETEEVDEEVQEPQDSVEYDTPFANSVNDDEFVDDEFELGVVEE